MEPNDAPSSSARAHELRASLGARREVEAMLAEASATREAAVADADAIIEEAQQVSEQLLQESRTEAERVSTDARHRAEGVVSRARSEAEDITRQARAAADAVRARAEAQVEEHRRRVRAELTEQVTREVAEQSRRELARVHERQQAMIGDLEASVRILGVSMEAAVANIAEMLGALDSLRTHTAESLGDTAVPFTTPPRHADPIDHLIRSTTGQPDDRGPAPVTAGSPAPDGPSDKAPDGATDAVDGADTEGTEATEATENTEDTGAGADEAGPTVLPPGVAYADEDQVSADELADLGVQDDDLDDDEDRPQSATEAFLRTTHTHPDPPPPPPPHHTEVGARYARDAMRATARSRSRRDSEPLEVVPESSRRDGPTRPGRDERDGRNADVEEGDQTDTSGKPLGWLFRSSS
jgi:cell division septum initiation protein DivIVA